MIVTTYNSRGIHDERQQYELGLMFSAVPADAVKLQRMLANLRKILGTPQYGIIRIFDLAAGNVLDAAAAHADQMVMIVQIEKFIMRVVMPKIDLPDDAARLQLLDEPINGRLVETFTKPLYDLLRA